MSITAQAFAQKAVEKALQRPRIPYVLGGRSDAGTDCSNLIRLILRNLGGKDIAAGSNSMWNSHVTNKAFIHDGGTNKGGGFLIPGALMFMDYNDPVNKGTSGAFAMDHVGIYVGNVPGLIAENGKQGNVVHASRSVGFVAVSTLQNAWTHVAWLKEQVNYGAQGGIVIQFPTTPEAPDLPGLPEMPEMPGLPEMPDLSGAHSLGPQAPTPEPGQAMVVTNDKKGLNLRKQPEVRKDNGIKTMPDNAIVDVVQVWGEWAEVRYVHWDGGKHKGWCKAEYLVFG